MAQDIENKPYPSWILDSEMNWQSPIALPEDESVRAIEWDEENLRWITEPRSGSI